MPEDKPTRDQIDKDVEFDKWLETYERRMSQKYSKKTKVNPADYAKTETTS